MNVPTILHNLKTKANNLDVGKLKTAPVVLQKLSDVADKENVKNTKIKHTKDKSK